MSNELKRFDIVGKYRDEETMYEYRPDGECYDADEVDALLAEKDKEISELKAENKRLDDLAHAHNLELLLKENRIEELKDKCQMHDFFWEGCGFAKRGFKNSIAVSEEFDRLEAENRRLKRALWLARAMRAEAQWNRLLRDAGICFAVGRCKEWDEFNTMQKKWQGVERKCRAMADKYGRESDGIFGTY